MWKTNFSLQHLKLIMSTKLFFRPKAIFAKNRFRSNTFFQLFWNFGTWSSRNLKTRNLKFPELGNLGTCLRISRDWVATSATMQSEVHEMLIQWLGLPVPANTLDQRRRWWANIKPALANLWDEISHVMNTRLFRRLHDTTNRRHGLNVGPASQAFAL